MIILALLLIGVGAYFGFTETQEQAMCDKFILCIQKREYSELTQDKSGQRLGEGEELPTLIMHRRGNAVTYYRGGLWLGQEIGELSLIPADENPDCRCTLAQQKIIHSYFPLWPFHMTQAPNVNEILD